MTNFNDLQQGACNTRDIRFELFAPSFISFWITRRWLDNLTVTKTNIEDESLTINDTKVTGILCY